MKFRRKFAVGVASIACSLALAACGEQIATHVEAGDSVHAGLTSVFNSNTTRFVITAENLPGRASIADGSFSVVITTSRSSGSSAASSNAKRTIDISIDHESTNLIDIREVNHIGYFRVDLKDIAAFGSPGAFASISDTLNALAAHPGLGYLHDVLAGDWVGISDNTLLTFVRQMERGLPGTAKPTLSPQKTRQLSTTIDTSVLASIRMWLSIHQTGKGEYALNLPIRSFVGSLVHQIAKPLEAYLKTSVLSQSELGKAVAKIPTNLSVHANMWVQGGSMTKLQIFVPDTNTSVVIGISHPSSPVAAPSGATILTAANLKALLGLEGSGLSGLSNSSPLSGAL